MNVESIQTVAVLGLGTMGHGIAQSFAAGGLHVRCWDEQPMPRSTLLDRVRGNLVRMAQAGIVAVADIEPTLGRIAVCDDAAAAVAPARFVVEAVSEDLDMKRQLFARIEPHVAADTILASNSSSFPISQSGDCLSRPERAVLTHWFNPPHIVPVVEIVPGGRTDDATVQTTVQLHEKIGKTAVRINQEVPGFLVNRVQVAMFREIWDLLERGVASAGEIDRAIRGSMGLRLAALGPLAIIDFAGWDITARVYQNLIPHLRSSTDLPECIGKLLDEGRLGVKSGKGIFDYPPESIADRQARRDRLYLALIKLLRDED
jgi:3-hydroxyacyl-CoA dehydrogenase